MKYPLSKDEWKWVILAVIMVTAMCVVFGTIGFIITGEETPFIASAILAMFFIWIKIISPILDRI